MPCQIIRQTEEKEHNARQSIENTVEGFENILNIHRVRI